MSSWLIPSGKLFEIHSTSHVYFSLSLGQPVLGRSKVKVDIWRPPGDRVEGEGPLATVEHGERYVSAYFPCRNSYS